MAKKVEVVEGYWRHKWELAKWNIGYLPYEVLGAAVKAAAVIAVARLLGVKI